MNPDDSPTSFAATPSSLRTRLARLEKTDRPAHGFGERLEAALRRPQRTREEQRADILTLAAGPLRDRLLRTIERDCDA